MPTLPLLTAAYEAQVYRAPGCAPATLSCRAGATDPETGRWSFTCTETATVCVHIELVPGRDVPVRTAFCEEHSISVRRLPGMSVVTRMHSIPAGYGVDARSDR